MTPKAIVAAYLLITVLGIATGYLLCELTRGDVEDA